MSITDELEKLSKLLGQGVITQEEFETQKQRLLAGPDSVSQPVIQSVQQEIPPMPPTYMAQAILATLFCCLPFGIVAIVKASGVSGAYAARDFARAQQLSRDASTWVNVAAVIGFIVIGLYFVSTVAGLSLFM